MSAELIWLPEKRRFEGVDVPVRFYQVLDRPAPLAGMCAPWKTTPWDAFEAAGFRYVVCLSGACPLYDPAPLSFLHAVLLNDLFDGNPPTDEGAEENRIRAAADAVLEKLRVGEGVIVHCMSGTGRTGTVIGCVLCRFGFSFPEVSAYLDEINGAREGAGWPVSEWQAEFVERFARECEG